MLPRSFPALASTFLLWLVSLPLVVPILASPAMAAPEVQLIYLDGATGTGDCETEGSGPPCVSANVGDLIRFEIRGIVGAEGVAAYGIAVKWDVDGRDELDFDSQAPENPISQLNQVQTYNITSPSSVTESSKDAPPFTGNIEFWGATANVASGPHAYNVSFPIGTITFEVGFRVASDGTDIKIHFDGPLAGWVDADFNYLAPTVGTYAIDWIRSEPLPTEGIVAQFDPAPSERTLTVVGNTFLVQTFIPEYTAQVDRLDLALLSSGTTAGVTVSLHDGPPGSSPDPPPPVLGLVSVAGLTINSTLGAFQRFDLPSPVTLTSGQTYSVAVSSFSDQLFWVASDDIDNYTQGRAYVGTDVPEFGGYFTVADNSDFGFRIYETDSDGDGAYDTSENSGPNGGDANGDGTPDSQQAHVASLAPAEPQVSAPMSAFTSAADMWL